MICAERDDVASKIFERCALIGPFCMNDDLFTPSLKLWTTPNLARMLRERDGDLCKFASWMNRMSVILPMASY